jgi:hypothetical protein
MAKQTKLPTPIQDALNFDGNQHPDSQKILESLEIGENPSQEQIQSVVYCSKLLNSGIATDAAIKQTLEQQKSSELAKSQPSAVVQQDLSDAQQAGIREVAEALTPEFPDINEVIVDNAVQVVGAIDQACKAAVAEAVFDPKSPITPNPEKAVHLFRARMAKNRQ